MVTISHRTPESSFVSYNYCSSQLSSIRDCPYYCLLNFLTLSNVAVFPVYLKLFLIPYFMNHMRLASPGNLFRIIKLGTAELHVCKGKFD